MDRVTFRVPAKMKADVQLLVERGYFSNPSEAWREAGRLFHEKHDAEIPDRADDHPYLDEDGNFVPEDPDD